jgi:glycosyltransferase involved in cell wall biosynthesis
MRILQISHRVPWPLNEGGTIGIYNYTKGYFVDGHEVTLLALDGNKHRTDRQEALKALQPFAKTTILGIDTDIKVLDAFKNLFTKDSYNVQRFYSVEFNSLIELTLSQNEYDVIQIEGTFAALYSETVLKNRPQKCLVVLRQHNVEYQIWERLAANSKQPLKKWYLSLLAKRLKSFESKHLNQYDIIVPVTEDDGKLFKDLGCTVPVVSSPAGIDTALWTPSENASLNKCYHLGSLEWMPNQEAMWWFINEIWPGIKSQFSNLEFYLAGKNMPSSFKQLKLDGIHVVDYVADATEFVSDKGINIVPLLSGSGIRLKILEAMSAGKIVVSTTIGAQGINYSDKNLLIADSLEQFITVFSLIQKNPINAKLIKEEARKLIIEEYSNQKVIKDLISTFEHFLLEKK